MPRINRLIEVDEEWYIKRYKEGLQLVQPESLTELDLQKKEQLIKVRDLINKSINVYFLDCQSVIHKMNETAVTTTGFMSHYDAIGYTALRISSPISFAEIRKNDELVLQAERMGSFENEVIFLTGETSPAIDYKFPWYNKQGIVQGIIGISIIMGSKALYPLTISIAEIARTGLLRLNTETGTGTEPQTAFGALISSRQVCGVYLSKREHECIQLLIKGLTAKVIAKMMGLSYRTIEHYIDNIKIKLNVSTRSELICKVMEQIL